MKRERVETDRKRRKTKRKRERERGMDGWMVYCIINGLTITILWVNDDERD